MMMNNGVKFVASIAISCILSLDAHAMTMMNAVRAGEDYNLAGKISAAKVDSAQYKVQESYASYWPQVNLSGKTRTENHRYGSSYLREDDEAAMLNASVEYNLIDFAREKQVNTTKSALAGAKFNYAIEKEKLSFDIIKAYVDVWKKSRMVFLTDEYASKVYGLGQKIDARVGGGLSPESDAIRAQASIDEARTQQENARNELADAKMNLQAMIGRVDLTDELLDENQSPQIPPFGTQQELEKENLLLKFLNSQVEQKKSEYEYTRSDDYPKVQLIGNYKDRYRVDAQSPDLQVYLQVSMPLFNGFHTTSKLGEAASEIKLSEYKLESASRDLKKNYASLLLEANKSVKIWQLNQSSVNKSEKTLFLYEKEFTMGNRPLSDIISSQRELFNAKKSELETKCDFYNYISAIYNLYGKTTEAIRYIGGEENVR